MANVEFYECCNRKRALLYDFLLPLILSLPIVFMVPVVTAAEPPVVPIIVAVYIDFDVGQLLIEGRNLTGKGDPVVVMLAETELLMYSVSASFVLAALPPGLIDGDYSLSITAGPGNSSDVYDLTVGAVGPPGTARRTRSDGFTRVTGCMHKGQAMKHLTHFFSNLTKKHLLPVLWNKYDVVLTLPPCVI